MPCIYLCAYLTATKGDAGHAFVGFTPGQHRQNVQAFGLSPRILPEGTLKRIALVIPAAGQIYDDTECLGDPNLKYHRWDVELNEVAALSTHINMERKRNAGHIEPSDSKPADEIVKGDDKAGGPDYALLWSNCASWALEALESVGNQAINAAVSQYRDKSVDRPSAFYDALPNAGTLI